MRNIKRHMTHFSDIRVINMLHRDLLLLLDDNDD